MDVATRRVDTATEVARVTVMALALIVIGKAVDTATGAAEIGTLWVACRFLKEGFGPLFSWGVGNR
jgi:hypothetical protein